MQSEIINLYKDRTDVALTTYILQDSPELLNGKKRPAVVICPGGAYLGCSDREAEPVALRFAAMGYHAFVLRYSVYKESNQEELDYLNPLIPKEHCQYPRPMLDIGKAMMIIHEHAGEWLVDVDRIALCGFSAGAHNCAMYATNWHKPIITEFFGKGKEAFRPAAVILGYMLSDYIYLKNCASDNMIAKGLSDISNTAYLGTAEVADEILRQVSPARNISKETPPTFIWATAADELVPVQHSIRMANALAEERIPFEFHVFEEGAHGLSLADQASSEAKNQLDADAAKWIELAQAWLLKRFALPLPEVTAMEEYMKRASCIIQSVESK